jgi:hypothetical protein
MGILVFLMVAATNRIIIKRKLDSRLFEPILLSFLFFSLSDLFNDERREHFRASIKALKVFFSASDTALPNVATTVPGSRYPNHQRGAKGSASCLDEFLSQFSTIS